VYVYSCYECLFFTFTYINSSCINYLIIIVVVLVDINVNLPNFCFFYSIMTCTLIKEHALLSWPSIRFYACCTLGKYTGDTFLFVMIKIWLFGCQRVTPKGLRPSPYNRLTCLYLNTSNLLRWFLTNLIECRWLFIPNYMLETSINSHHTILSFILLNVFVEPWVAQEFERLKKPLKDEVFYSKFIF